MGRSKVDYLSMKTDGDMLTAELMDSDMNELKVAAIRLFEHSARLGGLSSGTSFLKWVASLAAIYLLILDRTNWRTNMLTSLLVPYIFFSMPPSLFHFLRGEFGLWVAIIAVVLRLFFPRRFPGKTLKSTLSGQFKHVNHFLYELKLSEMLQTGWRSLILLLVVAPNIFAHTLRHSTVGIVICLIIGCYLLQEHVRASGGFRNSFTQTHGFSNTVGIILLLVYPIWGMVLHFM